MDKIKVLIVDDSALVRQLLAKILEDGDEIEVVGVATDPFSARTKIKAKNPDVLTLDVEMPKMDGLTFLSNLMRLRPMPVVMVSSLTEKGADITLQALELGAVDFVTKPKIDVAHTLESYGEEIRQKVRAAAKARVRPTVKPNPDPITMEVAPRHSVDVVLGRKAERHFRTTDRLVAIGASTGGTEAIKDVLMQIPADSPIFVVTQHIPESFSGPFARRLDGVCAVQVKEARDHEQLLPGHAYIAPGSHHLMVERDGARYIARLSDGPPVNRHRPAVDVLFRSVAQNAGPNAVGVLLTGMGNDGAQGLLELREAGAETIAQDEATSVVWGMPGEAVKLDAVSHVLPLPRIAHKIMTLVGASTSRQAG